MEFTPVPSAAAGRLSASLLQWERHTATSGSLEAGGPTELMARSIMAQKVGFQSPPDVPSEGGAARSMWTSILLFHPAGLLTSFNSLGKWCMAPCKPPCSAPPLQILQHEITVTHRNLQRRRWSALNDCFHSNSTE